MAIKKPRFWLNKAAVLTCVKQAQISRLHKCALLVERDAKMSMKKGGRVAGRKTGVPSEPGTPPHVQTGNLRASISIGQTPYGTCLIGPTRQAWYGKIHEFGGRYHPPRPFMRPALWRMKGQFALLYKDMNLASTPMGRILNSMKGRLP